MLIHRSLDDNTTKREAILLLTHNHDQITKWKKVKTRIENSLFT